MTLDLTIQKAQLRLNVGQPQRQLSYVKLFAGSKQCHTMISRGPNPVWVRQMFRSAPEQRFFFEVCLPTGPYPQPFSDKVFAKTQWDFRTFAIRNDLENIDDNTELEVELPLFSADNTVELGRLCILVKYIAGKIHIGGLHPFSQIDLTFEDVNPKSGVSASNVRPLTPMSPLVTGRRFSGQVPPATPTSFVPPGLSVTGPGNQIAPMNPMRTSTDNPYPISPSKNFGQNMQISQTGQFGQFGPNQNPLQTSIGKQNPFQQPQIHGTVPVPVPGPGTGPSYRPDTGMSQMSGQSLVGLRQPWLLVKSVPDKLNIFSILDSTNKPWQVAPGRIHYEFCKSRMRTPPRTSRY